MSRLGMEAAEWAALRGEVLAAGPDFIMSRLACGDEADHPANIVQLAIFHRMTDGVNMPRPPVATWRILLRHDCHFDLARPGIDHRGGLPFAAACQVVRLSRLVIPMRMAQAVELLGCGAIWTTDAPCRIAAVAAGYAEGFLRVLFSTGASLCVDGMACRSWGGSRWI